MGICSWLLPQLSWALHKPGKSLSCLGSQCPQLRNRDVIPISWDCWGQTVALRPWKLVGAGPHLGAELLGGQLEGGCDLLGQHIGFIETKGVEGDLSNHGVIWNHHGHRPEERLGSTVHM